MYYSLRTNLPKEVMAFPDFPFPSVTINESFLHRTQVLDYLKSYARHFDVAKFIEFNTIVSHVEPRKNGPKQVWSVTIQNLVTGHRVRSEFDAIMVCNGHYSAPYIPDLEGLANFTGLTMHSHDYRVPRAFARKTVAVLGVAASGSDIGLEISSVAQKVFLCHNNPPLPSILPENMQQKKGIEKIIGPTEICLSDGTTLANVDAILFCTGYNYSFPFLDEACRPLVKNRVVSPLYKHMIHVDYPTLCFIGIPIQICPFPQFDLQVQLFIKSLAGDVELPSREAMLEDTQEEMAAKKRAGAAAKHFHKMGSSQWDYNRSLCKLAQLREVPLCVEMLYNDVHERRKHNLTTYKKDAYALKGDTYKVID